MADIETYRERIRASNAAREKADRERAEAEAGLAAAEREAAAAAAAAASPSATITHTITISLTGKQSETVVVGPNDTVKDILAKAGITGNFTFRASSSNGQITNLTPSDRVPADTTVLIGSHPVDGG